MSTLSETHQQTLAAVCDTVVPSLRRDVDPDGFFSRKASDLGVPVVMASMIETMAPEQRDGLLQLLDALAEQGLGHRLAALP